MGKIDVLLRISESRGGKILLGCLVLGSLKRAQGTMQCKGESREKKPWFSHLGPLDCNSSYIAGHFLFTSKADGACVDKVQHGATGEAERSSLQNLTQAERAWWTIQSSSVGDV